MRTDIVFTSHSKVLKCIEYSISYGQNMKLLKQWKKFMHYVHLNCTYVLKVLFTSPTHFTPNKYIDI